MNEEEEERLDSAIEKFADEISSLWKNEPLNEDETKYITCKVLVELDRCNGNTVNSEGDSEETCYMVETWIKITDESVELYTKEEGEKEVEQSQLMQPENMYRLVQV